jgi:CheY-like chemotaxis protein
LKAANSYGGTPYALVLLDMRLPEMGGDAVLRELRKIEQTKQKSRRAKIIMITSGEEEKNVPDQIRNNCEGLLAKPIVKSDLLQKLKSLGLISA